MSAGVAHQGGIVGVTPMPLRVVDAHLFDSAQRYHRGGRVGANEVPIIAERGETIVPRGGRAVTERIIEKAVIISPSTDFDVKVNHKVARAQSAASKQAQRDRDRRG